MVRVISIILPFFEYPFPFWRFHNTLFLFTGTGTGHWRRHRPPFTVSQVTPRYRLAAGPLPPDASPACCTYEFSVRLRFPNELEAHAEIRMKSMLKSALFWKCRMLVEPIGNASSKPCHSRGDGQVWQAVIQKWHPRFEMYHFVAMLRRCVRVDHYQQVRFQRSKVKVKWFLSV